MLCKYCYSETRMTVKDKDDFIFPCCKKCKDLANGSINKKTGYKNMKLVVSLIFKEEFNEA